jgi:hypothetical protein
MVLMQKVKLSGDRSWSDKRIIELNLLGIFMFVSLNVRSLALHARRVTCETTTLPNLCIFEASKQRK